MDTEAKLQWLLDRAAIGDLMCSFARALDTKDFRAYADHYIDGGTIELPASPSGGDAFVLHKEHMLELMPKTIGRFAATQHLVANHQVTIDGNTASSTVYLQAVHVSGTATEHWTGGGFYECAHVRTADGWKLSRVKLTRVWLDGQLRYP